MCRRVLTHLMMGTVFQDKQKGGHDIADRDQRFWDDRD